MLVFADFSFAEKNIQKTEFLFHLQNFLLQMFKKYLLAKRNKAIILIQINFSLIKPHLNVPKLNVN